MARSPLGERIKGSLIARAGGALITSTLRSGRYEVVQAEEHSPARLRAGHPKIYLLWHGRLLPCAFAYRHCGLATLISQNRDGDHIARVVEGWGYRVVRGSSSRGGAEAFRAILRLLQEGVSIALTPDGPRGPRQKMKLGPLLAAQRAGVPVVPASAGASAGWYFGRWDRFLVPRPFTRIPIAFGEPLELDPDAGEDEVAESAQTVERTLNRLTEIVDAAARPDR